MITRTWKIETAVGRRSITVETDGRAEPVLIYLDGKQHAATVYQKGILAKICFSFTVDGEELLLVAFGTKIDLVFRGKFLTSGEVYMPGGTVPLWVKVLLVTVNLALIVIGIRFGLVPILFGINGTIFCCLLVSPFYTKQKAILISVFITAVCWLMSVVFVLAMNYWRLT